MQYAFLEKNKNVDNSIKSNYFYNYYYYITPIKNYIYDENTAKQEINFSIEEIEENHLFKIRKFTQTNSNGSEDIIGEIFSYVLANNLFYKDIIKFTLDDNNNIIKAE